MIIVHSDDDDDDQRCSSRKNLIYTRPILCDCAKDCEKRHPIKSVYYYGCYNGGACAWGEFSKIIVSTHWPLHFRRWRNYQGDFDAKKWAISSPNVLSVLRK